MALVRFTRRQPRITFPSLAGFSGVPTFDELENRMRKFEEGTAFSPFDGETLSQVIGWLPPTEIVETADTLTLTAELPGMDQKDIDISVEDGVLSIRGEKATENKEGDDKKFHLLERSYGSFQRSFTLPPAVDASKITAAFTQGVLKVQLPKTAEAKVKGRKIEIGAK